MPKSLKLLTTPTSLWVDIEVNIALVAPEKARINSIHTLPDGRRYRHFQAEWIDLDLINTEYGHGISLIHDLKDHYFYGLGITDLTELQTIVQTYYGREVSGGEAGVAENGDYKSRIKAAIHDELVGPRGPRVYDPEARALLDIYAADASDGSRLECEQHMQHVCLAIMLPHLEKVYAEENLLRQLQASTRDQPQLIEHFEPQIVWLDEKSRLMRLRDNVNLKLNARAYVNEKLAAMSESIRNQIRDYAKANDLLNRYGKIFDTKGYLIARRIRA